VRFSLYLPVVFLPAQPLSVLPYLASNMKNILNPLAFLFAALLLLSGSVAMAQTTTQAANPYPDTSGSLAFEKTYINMGQLRSDENRVFAVGVKNVGENTLNVKDVEFEFLPFKTRITQNKLKPGETALVEIDFQGDLGDAAGWGKNYSTRDYVTLYTDDDELEAKQIEIAFSYKRVYTEEEIANGPALTFESDNWEAGDILQGQVISHAFYFTNTGKSDLVIEKTKASCGCTAIEPTQKVIRPGERSKIEVRFNSRGKRGTQHKTVSVWSNDLKKPYQTLHVRCNIIEDPFSQPVN